CLFQGGEGGVFLGVLGGDVGRAGRGGGLLVPAAERYFLDEDGQYGQDSGEQDGPAEDVGDGRGQGFQDGDADRGGELFERGGVDAGAAGGELGAGGAEPAGEFGGELVVEHGAEQ